MAKHTARQKNIVGNIKGQLLGGTIGALILLLIWVNTFNNDPPDPRDLTDWTFFALFAILPVSLLLLLAPLHARRLKSLTLPNEERARFVIFVQRYTHVSRHLFLWICFAALPAVILRWIDASLGFFLAAIVALLCGIGSIYELRAYYRAVEAYVDVLPPDLLQEEIEEAQKLQWGWTDWLCNGMMILLALQLLYEWWLPSNSQQHIPMIPKSAWQTWSMTAIVFFLVLAIINHLLFMFLLRRWIKKVSRDSA